MRSKKKFVLVLALINLNAFSALACHGNSECPSGYVCDTAAGGACHDPCGTWFPQPNPQCPHHLLESVPQEQMQTVQGEVKK